MDQKLSIILHRILDFLHIKHTEGMIASLLQFIKFGIVGVSNTLIAYCLNITVLLLLRPYNLSWDYVVGNIVAFLLSVLWSFYWNNKYVFKLGDGQKRAIGKTLFKTYLSYAFTGIVLNNILSFVWIDMLHISKFTAPIINLLVSVPLNFIINKRWAFKV